MAKPYRQLSYLERKRIEEGLDASLSFRAIADMLERSASTISREVAQNRMRKRWRAFDRRHCAVRSECVLCGVCGDECPYKGHELCSECAKRNCEEFCERYAKHSTCSKLNASPWVCNGCVRRRLCRKHGGEQWLYDAEQADVQARERRSVTRRGMDMDPKTAEAVLSKLKDGLARGLSPYEMSVAFSGSLPISASTIYRWIDAGYGKMCNIELERKVGFKVRKHHAKRTPTRHTSKRSYERYLALPEEIRLAHVEMDTVIGRKTDDACILTLYLACCHFQFFLLLADKTEDKVTEALRRLRKTAGDDLFLRLFAVVLTDNGCEFADEARLARALGERKGADVRLFYCDVRASNQKGSCEKNHTELRQILPKGAVSFDELCARDMAVCMSHVNSNPRASLCGASPIALFKAAFGDAGCALLDAYGIEEIPVDELILRPFVLNRERDRRGGEPLVFLK